MYSGIGFDSKLKLIFKSLSLELRRSGSRLCLFYKIIYGLVAINMPSYYVVRPLRTVRISHTIGFCQIQTSVYYYKYSFYPLSIVLWNRLPAQISCGSRTTNAAVLGRRTLVVTIFIHTLLVQIRTVPQKTRGSMSIYRPPEQLA